MEDFYYIEVIGIINAIVDPLAEELYHYTIERKKNQYPTKGNKYHQLKVLV